MLIEINISYRKQTTNGACAALDNKISEDFFSYVFLNKEIKISDTPEYFVKQ